MHATSSTLGVAIPIQQQQQQRHLWSLQVPPSAPSYPSPSGASPLSGMSSEYSPSPASAYPTEPMPPWWTQQQAPLQLDMSTLSVASADASPIAQPAFHHAHPHPLTPVSPPHDGTGSANPRKRSLTMYEAEDFAACADDADVHLQFESASPVEGEPEHGLPAAMATARTPPAKAGGKGANHNFVVKLYNMIENTQSAEFIQWSENGTSFVVSSISEFSRLILGSHFKHSNFSSFVRQLNMYGFHKLNRTPRAQRGAEDQVWEFSHARFLRGRPDLLEHIRRKASDDASASVSAPPVSAPAASPVSAGAAEDVHAQLAGARAELAAERRRFALLAGVTKQLHDVLRRAHPLGPFPAELLEPEWAGSPSSSAAEPAPPAWDGAPWMPAPWAAPAPPPAPKRARVDAPVYAPAQRPLGRARSDEQLLAASHGPASAWSGLGMPSPAAPQPELMPSIARMGRASVGDMY